MREVDEIDREDCLSTLFYRNLGLWSSRDYYFQERIKDAEFRAAEKSTWRMALKSSLKRSHPQIPKLIEKNGGASVKYNIWRTASFFDII